MCTPVQLSPTASITLKDNSSCLNLDCSIGSSCCTAASPFGQSLFERCSQVLMLKPPVVLPLSPMFGKKTRRLQIQDLKSARYRVSDLQKKIGKISGVRQRLETLYQSQPTSVSDAILHSNELQKIIWFRQQLSDKYWYFTALLERAKVVVRGMKRVLTPTPKTPTRNSGTATTNMKMSSSTSSEVVSPSAIYSDGLTDIPWSSKLKEVPFASPPERSGLHQIFTL